MGKIRAKRQQKIMCLLFQKVTVNTFIKKNQKFVLILLQCTEWVFLCTLMRNLTLYMCPESAPCASAGPGMWHHDPARHAGSCWGTRSVDRSGRPDGQNSRTERRRDECKARLTMETSCLWAQTHTHTYSFPQSHMRRAETLHTHTEHLHRFTIFACLLRRIKY